MKTYWKTALAALAVTAGSVAAVPASAQSFGLGFGPEGGIRFSYDSGGYCDPFGCPDDFWDMPVYYGAVFWHGAWYDGPVYYREAFGRRQFWIHGDWRNDEWRGPHPGWWREGRYGPPLGVDYYRSNGFHGRWDRGGNDRRDHGRDNGSGFDQRDNGRGYNQEDGGRGFDQRGSNRGDGGRGFNQRDSDQAARGGALDQRGGPQPQAAPQQPQRQYSNPPPPGFQPRNGAYGHYTRPNPAAAPAPAPAAAPAPAPAAAPAAPATGDRRHDH
jgi:hypothetical protein